MFLNIQSCLPSCVQLGEEFSALQHQCHEIESASQFFTTSEGVTPIHHLMGKAKSHSERYGIAFLLVTETFL